jgi:hypothetical protein
LNLRDFVADLFLEGRDAHVDQPEALVGEQDIVKNLPANVGGAFEASVDKAGPVQLPQFFLEHIN